MRSVSRRVYRAALLRTVALVAVMAAVVPGPTGAMPPAADVFEVPLSLVRNHLAVPVVAADGTELQFMLSTGTPVTLVSESAAARVDPTTLRMGDFTIADEETRTIADARLEVDGHQFDGIVGATVLSHHDVLLDVPNGRMLLRTVGPPAAWEGVSLGEPVPLRVFHGVVLSTDIKLNGHDYMAQLEIGINKVIVNEPVTRTLGFEGETSGTVTLAGREFGDLPVHHIEVDVFERWDPDNNGFVLVGAPVARDCAIAISWIRSEMQVCTR